MSNGNLQFEILQQYKKSIKPELLILAYETYKMKPEIKIDYGWVKFNGHNNWCTPKVMITLFEMYDNSLNNKLI